MFAPAHRALQQIPAHPDARARAFFDAEAPVRAARAPGRLDVMGGIADYSGSLVLELPLACATYAMLQPQAAARVDVASLLKEEVMVASLPLSAFTSAEALRARFAASDDAWAAYVFGPALWAVMQAPKRPAQGFRLFVTSDVPVGKGVSSSAALEVAVLQVVADHLGLALAPERLAAAAQWAEHAVAGAPCGIMDQMTVTLGRAGHLLRLLCQPAKVEGHVAVPPGYAFFGIDSGVRHAVGGVGYGAVRCAAFMGYRILADAAGGDPWGGYLANVAPDRFEQDFADHLPEQMSGEDFLARFDGTPDSVTAVDPDGTYPVRAAAAHPVYEHARVRRFAELMERLPRAPEAALEMGALMEASHASYSACGLGSAGTDRLVELVGAAGLGRGLFGARITGGGSGGTIAVFARAEAEPAVRAIARAYAEEAGHGGAVFAGSSPGAAATGVVTLDPNAHPQRPAAGSSPGASGF